MNEMHVYRLTARADWEGAGDVLAWNADDMRDGFFHLSAYDQVSGTAQAHYADVEDLWVLALDAGLLGAALRWEPSRGGALFPHYYGDVPRSAVVAAGPFAPGAFC